MTCQGIRAVLAICHVVASVVKANAQNSVLQLRCFCALVIQLLQPASCFKTNSTYRQPSVITASLYCHCPPMLQISFCGSCLQFSTEYHLLLQGFMFCLQQVACIFSIVAAIVGSEELSEASQILSCLSDMVYCSVCACMQTQHKVEMDKRDGKFGPQPMQVPPMQQMSRIDQPVPAPAGYAPQPAYGQPYGAYPPPPAQGYPPPPAQGYPPAGYPPAGYPQAQGSSYPPPGDVKVLVDIGLGAELGTAFGSPLGGELYGFLLGGHWSTMNCIAFVVPLGVKTVNSSHSEYVVL
ncbi:hypothetical protein TRIUR3_25674 [Triticum urartu]|uniref:Rhodopsin n=2 Tax=Triticum TaxID=4564 RepID=A0A9R0U435_TRITD|nr:hypothetical protein TRIUR3_25674 [Triticum urartu]VAI25113.1 unnamed protein product [Triticum turgidum subsp. durum]